MEQGERAKRRRNGPKEQNVHKALRGQKVVRKFHVTAVFAVAKNRQIFEPSSSEKAM